MRPKRGLILGLVLAILLAGGFVLYSRKSTPAPAKSGSTPKQTDQVSPHEGQAKAISIQGSSFQPATITVKKGTTVTWTNQDSVSHTVTNDDSGASGPNSGLLGQGQKYSFTFDTAGTFMYHCNTHTSMHGVVVVTP